MLLLHDVFLWYLVVIFGIKALSGLFTLMFHKEWPLRIPLQFSKTGYSIGMLENLVYCIVPLLLLVML